MARRRRRIVTTSSTQGPETEVAVELRGPDDALLARGRFRARAVFADGLTPAELDALGECNTGVRAFDAGGRRLGSFPHATGGRRREAVQATPADLSAGDTAVRVSVLAPWISPPARLERFGREWRGPQASGLYLAAVLSRRTSPVRVRLCDRTAIRLNGRSVTKASLLRGLRRHGVNGMTITWSVRHPAGPSAVLARCPARVTARGDAS